MFSTKKRGGDFERVPVKQFLIPVKQWGPVFILFDGEAKLCNWIWIYEEGEIIGARVTVDNGKRRFWAVVPIEWVYVEKKGGQSEYARVGPDPA